jgi:AraC-like DNA-binding protein
LLEAKPGRVELPAVAKALGMSARTLQRHLAEHGTSFQLEMNAAQVRIAQRLLSDGDANLSSIATEVGCASLQHFSALFHRVTGERPSAWRAAAKKLTSSRG